MNRVISQWWLKIIALLRFSAGDLRLWRVWFAELWLGHNRIAATQQFCVSEGLWEVFKLTEPWLPALSTVSGRIQPFSEAGLPLHARKSSRRACSMIPKTQLRVFSLWYGN